MIFTFALGVAAGLVLGAVAMLVKGDADDTMHQAVEFWKKESRGNADALKRALATTDELREACKDLRWLVGADKCIRCDMVCEDPGRCPLDERLGSLGVTVPEWLDPLDAAMSYREVGHVSQCREEDET